MKGLVFQGPGRIEFESFSDPELDRDDQLILRVTKCSICGSDLHIYNGESMAGIDFGSQHKPFCVGHEAIGEVVEVGGGVKHHRVGDKVLVQGGFGCGQCRRCLAGQVPLCERGDIHCYGVTPGDQGGQAEYLKVAQADLTAMKIPDFMSDEQALLMTDALATGYYGAKRSGVEPGDTVAVVGLGPVGLMATESAIALGAERVFAIDLVKSRRHLAAAVGAIPLEPQHAVAAIMEATGGVGADRVIEAVGIPSTGKLAVALVRPGGAIGVVGMLPDDAALPMVLAQLKSVTVSVGVAGVAALWPELTALIKAEKIAARNIFTHRMALSDGAEAYRLFNAREDSVIKVLLDTSI